MMLAARRVVIVLVLAAVAVGAFYLWAIKRAFTGAAQQLAPTTAEKNLEARGEAEAQRIEAEAAKEHQELDDAEGSDLLDLARKRLFRRP